MTRDHHTYVKGKRGVPANEMVFKLREELKNDGAFLFGLIFLAYLDIRGEYLFLLHPLFAFMYAL